ncbi:MAG: hypothetical protein JJ974_02450 [Phycisphaerales bacterium]|nr:hypothetical protein [Phycisphaerales bacterium]
MSESDPLIQVHGADADTYVSRGGLKLHHAFAEFGFDPTGLICADFGCSTGGFTDCALHHGAAHVHCIDTAYGQLAWKLRQDERTTVHERSNALHTEPPPEVSEQGGVDLIVMDLGWTKQDRALAAARTWLKDDGKVISLVKPHYEATKEELEDGMILTEDLARSIAERVRDSLPEMGWEVLGWTQSPLLGSARKKKRKNKGKGNPEWLVLLTPTQ